MSRLLRLRMVLEPKGDSKSLCKWASKLEAQTDVLELAFQHFSILF